MFGSPFLVAERTPQMIETRKVAPMDYFTAVVTAGSVDTLELPEGMFEFA